MYEGQYTVVGDGFIRASEVQTNMQVGMAALEAESGCRLLLAEFIENRTEDMSTMRCVEVDYCLMCMLCYESKVIGQME